MAENKDKMLAYKASYSSKPEAKAKKRATANRSEEVKQARRNAANAYVARNRAAVNAAAAEYRSRNKGKRAKFRLKRRAAELQRIPKWFGELDEFVAQEAAELRVMRTNMTGIPWEVDHIVPLRGGLVSGLHVWNNLQVIPRVVNRQKSNDYGIS